MYFFIAIVLIAELIITANIISLILKLDKKVCALSDRAAKSVHTIKLGILSFQIAATRFAIGVHTVFKSAENRRQLYIKSIFRNLVMYALLFILKGKCRKYLSVCQLACALKDCWEKGAACNL